MFGFKQWIQDIKDAEKEKNKKYWDDHKKKLKEACDKMKEENEAMGRKKCPIAPDHLCYPDCVHFQAGRVIDGKDQDLEGFFRFHPKCKLWGDR